MFAFIYGAILIVLKAVQWWSGGLLGLAHALCFGTAILNVWFPLIHPRMGTSLSAANSTPLLEPPGFMLINYGRGTPIVTILAHMAYGALIGYFVGWEVMAYDVHQEADPIGESPNAGGNSLWALAREAMCRVWHMVCL